VIVSLVFLVLAVPPPCGDCHQRENAAWLASRHAVSASNELYRVNYAHEPMQWCQGCHAPVEKLGEATVGCISCHVRDGVVLSAHVPSTAALKAHAMRHDASLASADFCGSCHQFNFPIGRHEPVQLGEWPMQNTVAEWRASGIKASCHDCHDVHRAPGGHNLELLRAAVAVDVKRIEGGEVRVTLRSRNAGHRFPTGDPFRRLRIDLCAAADCNEVLTSREMERAIVPVGDTWRIDLDGTLPPLGSRELEVVVPERARAWRLVFIYAARSSEAFLSSADYAVELYSGGL
jgi:hypothetical protein